jgi:1-aminocyclopropane-1-carboxylate deaminase/D-cysteine desulfhydrase-like pyridoxal-dependent ACC family enzyme
VAIGNLPTRLLRVESLGEEIGVDLWVKNEFEADAFGSGNKMRKLEYLLPQIARDGYDGLIIDGTTQSNCAMSLALYAPRFGLSVDLILYGPTTHQGNYVDILRSGARLTSLPEWSPTEIEAARKRLVDEAAQDGRRLTVVPTGATNEVTAFGTVHLAEELARQEAEYGIKIDAIVFPTASGGTQAGLEIGRAALDKDWRLIGIGVANDEAFFEQVVRSIARAPLARQLLGDEKANEVTAHTHMGAVGERYGIPLPGAFAEIRDIRERHGVVLDSLYTHKALTGLRQLVDSGELARGSTVVFIHTGGLNERFLDDPTVAG